MSDLEKRFDEKPIATTLIVGSSIIAILFILAIVFGLFSAATAPIRAVTGVVNRTLNSDNVLANYEWFKRQNEDVQAIDARLDASRKTLAAFERSAGPRSQWTFEDKQESSRLGSVILGLEGQRASMVAEYNARTQMANRDLFRTKDLPQRLQ